MPNPNNLQHFVDAQLAVYETAIAEIRAGAKQSHWMWFIFPQIAGLGQSAIAKVYSIRSIEEARAYLNHPVLGQRLRECVAAVLATADTTAEAVFGPIDALKLRSSLTLFIAAGGGALFSETLDHWFEGQDQKTLMLLDKMR